MYFLSTSITKRIGSVKHSLEKVKGIVTSPLVTSPKNSFSTMINKMGHSQLSNQSRASSAIKNKQPSGTNFVQKSHYSQDFDKMLDSIIHDKMAELENSPLIKKRLSPDSPLSEEEQLAEISPEMIEFVMGFADFNIYFLRYIQTYTTYFQDIINKHTIEDRTHSKLFTLDWRLLNVDKYVNWNLLDYMSWTLSPSVSKKMKAEVLKLYSLVLKSPHPLVRYSIMEVIEHAGLIFFTHTSPIAERLQEKNGYEYKYFGPYHLKREDGGIGLPETTEEEERARVEEIEQLNDMYHFGHDKNALYKMVDYVCHETHETFSNTFQSWYDISNDLHEKKADFYHDHFKKDLEDYEKNTNYHDSKTPHSFFAPSSNSTLYEEINFSDIAVKANNKLDEFDAKKDGILPFTLINMVGVALICSSDDRYADSSNSDEKLCHYLSQTIGKMGHALIHDYKELGWGGDFSNDISSLLSYKFFSPRSDLHRTNFAMWFKSILAENDPAVRAMYLKITMDAYRHLMHGFYDNIHNDVKDKDLDLFNGKWFYYFNKNTDEAMKSMENSLNAQQREKVVKFKIELMNSLNAELDATKPKKSLDPEPQPENNTINVPTCG